MRMQTRYTLRKDITKEVPKPQLPRPIDCSILFKEYERKVTESVTNSIKDCALNSIFGEAVAELGGRFLVGRSRGGFIYLHKSELEMLLVEIRNIGASTKRWDAQPNMLPGVISDILHGKLRYGQVYAPFFDIYKAGQKKQQAGITATPAQALALGLEDFIPTVGLDNDGGYWSTGSKTRVPWADEEEQAIRWAMVKWLANTGKRLGIWSGIIRSAKARLNSLYPQGFFHGIKRTEHMISGHLKLLCMESPTELCARLTKINDKDNKDNNRHTAFISIHVKPRHNAEQS